MQTLFDYYELMISVDKENYCKPLEFVCVRGVNACIVRLYFEAGLYKGLGFYAHGSMESIDETDKLNVRKIIENNLDYAVRQWIGFHIYGHPVKEMLIKTRIS